MVSLLKSGFDYNYCSCGYTTFELEKSKLKKCVNPKCERKIVTGRYDSIRSLLALIFSNDDLMEKIKKERELNEQNPELLDRIGKGSNYKNHKNINKDIPNSFVFNLRMSMDGCNVHDKTMFNLYVSQLITFDLPPELNKES